MDGQKKGCLKNPTKVIHILKSGEVIENITGHEVTKQNAPGFYQISERIKRVKHERDT